MKALYPLRSKIASYDFFSWLVLVKAWGYTEVVFDPSKPKTSKWPAEIVMRRFQSILLPGPALAGLASSIGVDGEDPVHTDAGELIRRAQDGFSFEPLRSVHPAADVRYTVTLRRDWRIPERNSNEPAWREFAREIGALVIEDFDVAPIDLHTRAALYAGADMNFFVPNGPMHLCSLMGAPLMCFNANKCAPTLARTGIAYGGNYPWHGKDQIFVWEDDSIDNIRRNFQAWQESRCVPED